MSFVRSMSRPVFALVVVLTVCGLGVEPGVEVVIDAMAFQLEQAQDKTGWDMGSWPSEELFTGSITSGMARAYEWTGNYAYRTASRRAGYYILRVSDEQGSLLGDEAYALVRLSEEVRLLESGLSDVWQPALVEFYGSMRKPGYEESTEVYLSYFEGEEPSTTVFFIAHHVMAAYYIDDPDKELWRDALVYHLSRVDDTSGFPVMALGTATWALARIDRLDDMPVPSDSGATHWEGVVLSDLPTLLLSHQVPVGEPLGGSFYWRFDHTSGGLDSAVAGYTEDAIYGTLGLIAVASLEGESPEGLQDGIVAAREVLLQGVDDEGKVYEHLSLAGQTYHAFAGEMLQVLWDAEQYLDSEGDK